MFAPRHGSRRRLTLLLAGLLGFGSVPAAELSCPGNTVRIVVPNPAGGAGDFIARTVGERASADLGQSIVIENRAGGTTTIGTDYAAKARPDGCTILLVTASNVVVTLLREKLPYDLWRDFTPVVGIGSWPMVLAVSAASNIQTFSDLVAAAKSREGITYASGGAGSLAHLSAARLVRELGGTGNHVPFKGNADAIQSLLGNHTQMFFPSSGEALPLMKAGKIRVLGITSDERLATMPEVPTMKELRFADFNPRLWYVFLAPSQTPADVVTRLHDAFAKATRDPAVRERLAALGYATETRSGAESAALMRSEAARWGQVIRDNGIKAGD